MRAADIKHKSSFDLTSQFLLQEIINVVDWRMNDQNSGMSMEIYSFFELFVLWIGSFENVPYSDLSSIDLDTRILAPLEPTISTHPKQKGRSHTRYNAVAPFSSV